MPAAASLHCLVVDDQMTMRSLVRTSLQQLGVREIREAADGEIALRELVAKPVHLVISDYNMPNLDGLGLLRAVRAHPPTSKTSGLTCPKRPLALSSSSAACGAASSR